jgi:hypothetical protein
MRKNIDFPSAWLFSFFIFWRIFIHDSFFVIANINLEWHIIHFYIPHPSAFVWDGVRLRSVVSLLFTFEWVGDSKGELELSFIFLFRNWGIFQTLGWTKFDEFKTPRKKLMIWCLKNPPPEFLPQIRSIVARIWNRTLSELFYFKLEAEILVVDSWDNKSSIFC